MGVINKFMSFLGLQEEEEVIERKVINERDEESDEQSDEAEAVDSPFAERRKAKNNVVSIHSQKNVRVVLSEPRSYDETQGIADHLRSRRSVVVNLQRVRADQAMRIIDFLSGTVYALNGNITKIGSNSFLCTPESVEVEGAITELMQGEFK